MIQLPPKKRVPELKLKKLSVTEPVSKRPSRLNTLPSVTTVIDGIPIIEYICDIDSPQKEFHKESTICLDSSDSVPPSPTGVQMYPRVEQPSVCVQTTSSPEPIKTFTVNNHFQPNVYEKEFHSDYLVAMKKPTRWDSGPRKNYQLDVRTPQVEQSANIVTDTNFQLKPRDPRIKTFRKHHRNIPEQKVTAILDDNLMDISSPEYDPPSPFSPLYDLPISPRVAFDTKITNRRTGFFDSESECSETEFSRESNFYQVLSTSVGRPPEYTGTSMGQEDQKKYFWDSSSSDESNNDVTQINICNQNEEITTKRYTIPRKSKLSSSNDDELENAKYSKTENITPLRSHSASSLKDYTEFKNENMQRRHVCIYCGDRGHASNDACPLRVCSLCFKIGHNYRECTARGKNRPPKCSRCRISCHEKNRCGEIWRQCHNTTFLPNDYPQSAKRHSYNVTMDTQAFRIDQLKSNLYCCNCANYGHVYFQCEKPHPSRYFYVPLVGHYDIPLSVSFREIRDTINTRRCLKSLLPKPYQVIAQNFWGDGNWNEDSDHGHSTDENGCQGNWMQSTSRKSKHGKKEMTYHFIETEGDKPPLKDLGLSSLVGAELQEYQKVAFNAYQLALEQANRNNPIYARDLLNNRGFLTKPPFKSRLAPMVYLPEEHTPARGVSSPPTIKEERRSRERTSHKQTEIKSTHKRDEKRREPRGTYSRSPSYKKQFINNKLIKHNKYEKNIHKRTLKIRSREKPKYDLKDKKIDKHFRDARECINRNRTKRQTQRHVRLSSTDDVIRTKSKNSPKRRYSPKRRKEHSPDTPVLKMEQILNIDSENGEENIYEETFMFIDEVN
ncbi:Zinc finger CCHC domain-containing protein 7 [Oopsacas minuta]|uniref:Zinc finger CCHC domain-containing protein 7 n=1 Tax=Oopsacas minuta TaxID=111878 RepID=A0AAV7JL00_9METZ|nr:Zinc finger CCHC domain-containing protein 7 [Oopsacas minuta]